MRKLNNVQKILLIILLLEMAILFSIWYHVLAVAK